MQYEKLNITNDLTTYFESKEDFIDFSNKVIKNFEELELKNYKNVTFYINVNSYAEYGDYYHDVSFDFEYQRELTQNELNEKQIKIKKEKENEKIFSELVGKLSSNSIGSIIHNEDLRKLYLEGNLIVNK